MRNAADNVDTSSKRASQIFPRVAASQVSILSKGDKLDIDVRLQSAPKVPSNEFTASNLSSQASTRPRTASVPFAVAHRTIRKARALTLVSCDQRFGFRPDPGLFPQVAFHFR